MSVAKGRRKWKPVTDLVVLFVPDWANMTHLHSLAQVAERFCDQRFREQLHACAYPRAVCQLFADFEAYRGNPDQHEQTL